MARIDLPSLIIRAKKMAGALGRVPSEGELIASFAKKGDDLSVSTAREILKAVQKHREASKPADRSSREYRRKESKVAPAPAPEPEPVSKPEPKPEISMPLPPVKRTTAYGWRR